MAYDDSPNGTKIVAAHVPTSGADSLSDESHDQLISLGSKLHAVFMSPEGAETAPGIPKSGLASPEELMESARQERCPLFNFICALGTGIWRQESMQQREGKHGSRIFTACQFQQVLAEQLRLYNVPKQVQEWLSKFRVSSSYTMANLKHFDKIDRKLLEGWDPGELAYGLIAILYDNLGFRIRGASAGYDQYTMIKLKLITKKMLDGIKVYGKNRLSWARKIWDEERKNDDNSASMFLPQPEDDAVLSDRTLGHIKIVMELFEKLPSIEQCIKQINSSLNDNMYGKYLPANFGEMSKVQLKECVSHTTVESEVSEDEVQEPDDFVGNSKPTFYERNNAKVEVPWHMDLACTETLVKLRKYGKHLHAKALENFRAKRDDSDSSAVSDAAVGGGWKPGFRSDGVFYSERGEAVEPFMESNGLKASRDGSPAYGFAVLHDERPEEDDGHFSNNSGPFHNYGIYEAQ
eukprot:scaffold91542_cov48-Attheya_sp.AAC.5